MAGSGFINTSVVGGAGGGGGAGSDTTAVHDNVAGEIAAVGLKAAPAAGDHVIIEDSAAGDVKKRATIGSITAIGSFTPYEAAGNPGANNDSADTAVLGRTFSRADMWTNTATGLTWICTDDSVGAAVWAPIVRNPNAVIDNSIARHDGTSGALLQAGIPTITDSGGISMSSAYALAAAPTEAAGFVQRNTTAAALGAQQWSPGQYQSGRGWETGVGSSDDVTWRRAVEPVQGAAVSSIVHWAFSHNGAGYADAMTLDSAGTLSVGFSYLNNTALGLDGALAIGAIPTETKSLVLHNTTNAVPGFVTQYSPAIYMEGSAWDGGAARAMAFRIENQPVGGATISGNLAVSSSIAGAAYQTVFMIASDGAFGSDYAHAIGVTPTAGNGSILLRNSTAAALGAQQMSPGFYQAGQCWETGVGSSDEVIWRRQVLPVQGAAAAGTLQWDVSLNGGAYANRMTLTSAGVLTAITISGSTSISSATVYCGVLRESHDWFFLESADVSLASAGGLDGVTTNLRNTRDDPLVLVSTNTARDAASAIIVASVYDRNAAALTNAATMRIHSFGWTNNADAYQEMAAIYADGSFKSDYAHAIGTTPSEGKGSIVLRNSTPAAGGAQYQFSPSLHFASQGWTGAATVETIARLTGVSYGADGALGVEFNTGGGGFSTRFEFQQAGPFLMNKASGANVLWGTDGGGNVGAVSASRPDNVYAKTSINAPTVVANVGLNGQKLELDSVTELVTILAAASTDTTILLPAQSYIKYVTVYVETVIPGPCTNFNVGTAVNATLFATNVLVAATTTDEGNDGGVVNNATAVAVRLTAVGGNPGAATGKVRVTIHYESVTVPTS